MKRSFRRSALPGTGSRRGLLPQLGLVVQRSLVKRDDCANKAASCDETTLEIATQHYQRCLCG